MQGVLWPVVHITQHPEPMYPAVANTSSNSRLGDVCQSQLWPMGSSHTLSHSINSNRYLIQMCHAYPDIAFSLNWHNSRGNNFTLALNINSKLQWQSTYVYGKEPIDFQWPHFLNGCLVAILDFSVSGWHGFGSVTQVCFGISVSNFMCMSFVAVGRSLTIVSYVAFKMAALWFWTMPPSAMERGYPSRSLIYNF